MIVSTAEGKVKGKECLNYLGEKFFGFLGIPYAKAPEGELRFKAPEPPESWDGIKDATKEGPPCPSRHLVAQYYIGKENNCLNLNVYTKNFPKSNNEELKPVMVFIHGGGFLYGNNKADFSGPEFLLSEDIVLVVINYRLGILGFIALEDESLNVPGNAGLKDQVMALKWVQRNINQFGGDPKNVTIFGQSAGSASVHFLMLSPLAKGLFHKAILGSGCALNIWAKGVYNAQLIADYLGYKEKDEKSILEKLKKESTRNLVRAQFKFTDDSHFSTPRPFGPVIEKVSENAFLSEEPIDIIRSGKYHKVPFIAGYTTKEGILFDLMRKLTPHIQMTDCFDTEVSFDFNINGDTKKHDYIKSKIQEFYFQNKQISEENIDEFYHLKTDFGFKYHIYKAMQLHNVVNENPIFFYIFSHEGPINLAKSFALRQYRVPTLVCLLFASITQGVTRANKFCHRLLGMIPQNQIEGSSHGDDLFYLFMQCIHPKIEVGSKEDFYVKRMVKLWTNFARYGHPTPEKDKELFNNVIWNPISESTLTYLNIDEELSMNSNPDKEMLKFWDSIYDFCNIKF